MDITDRELATVLAALRVYQEALGMNGGEPPAQVHAIACDGGFAALSVDEIDELCEKLNVDGSIALALKGLSTFTAAIKESGLLRADGVARQMLSIEKPDHADIIAGTAVLTGDIIWDELTRRHPLGTATAAVIDLVLEAARALTKEAIALSNVFAESVEHAVAAGRAQALKEKGK